jgi:hypothetical protein
VSLVSGTPRILARYGRAMTLRRRVGTGATFTDIAVTATLRDFSPEQLVGGVMQGDAEAVVGATHVLAVAGFAPPRKGDLLVADGRTWAVLGCKPRAVASTVVAYDLWIRGG